MFTLNRCIAYEVYDGFDISAASTTLNRCAASFCPNSCYKIWADDVTLVNCLGWAGDTAIVELYSTSTTNEGAPFANRYCWICRFEGDTIVTVRAYLDSTMVTYTMLRNEQPAEQ